MNQDDSEKNSKKALQSEAEHPFNRLQPDFILDAIDSVGLETDARILTLNSFENRVYQIGLHDQEPVIAKFYRPDRWSREQILEEHEFSLQLVDAEIDVVAPIQLPNGSTLFDYQGFYICVFPRKGGHPPDLENENTLAIIGRMLGRMHAIGRTARFKHRPSINCDSFAGQSFDYILAQWMPDDLKPSYQSLGADLLPLLQQLESTSTELRPLRTHGDFHPGNMISRDQQLFMVDLDDTRTALAIQDLWMMLPGETDGQQRCLDVLISAYQEFHDFDWREVRLIEYYRTLRILQQSAWIARRWSDPAFPANFTWFNSATYWSNHILMLREQLYELQQSL